MHATIDTLLEAAFLMWSITKLNREDQCVSAFADTADTCDTVFQPKVPTTSVPDSQHAPAQTQASALEPLQQLIQQMGGLQQQPAGAGHQSLLHSQPLSVPNTAVNKPDSESSPIQMFIRQLGAKTSKPQVCLNVSAYGHMDSVN